MKQWKSRESERMVKKVEKSLVGQTHKLEYNPSFVRKGLRIIFYTVSFHRQRNGTRPCLPNKGPRLSIT